MSNRLHRIRKSRRSTTSNWTAVLLVLLLGASASALAQQQSNPSSTANSSAPASDQAQALQEVIVTGTLLRNSAPTGSTVVSLDQATLNATGGFTVYDQLQSVPQIYNLGTTESSRTGTGGAINITYGNSINIRGLSPYATLTLLDGHRMPLTGTNDSSVDPDSFPSIMIQRIDIVADGSSATYGSDAIAGVANLILRRDVEGVEARVRYGTADEYDARSSGFLAGHNWGSGQISFGYENDYQSSLNGQYRSFFASNQTAEGGPNFDVPLCNPGNIVANGVTYAIPPGGVTPATAASLAPGTRNVCDVAKFEDILPRVENNDFALTFDQRISDGVSLYGDATYSYRSFAFVSAQSASQLSVPATNAYFVTPPGATLSPCSAVVGSPECETVDYWFGRDVGPQVQSAGFSGNYQGTIGFNIDLGGGWVLNIDGMAGRDHNQSLAVDELNSGALPAALASSSPASALNVFGGGNSSSVLQSIFDSEFLAGGYSGDQVYEFKINGGLFRLPGGSIDVAVGGQYRHDDLISIADIGPAAALFKSSAVYNRDSQAGYAEVLLPFIGPANDVQGIQRLDLDVAGRFEHYSDVGNTTNPKFGINWNPIDSLTVHGTWGTSFRAPLLSDLGSGGPGNVAIQTYVDPLSPTGSSQGYTLAAGHNDLKPETATTWTLGLQYKPIAQAEINVDFFDIDYKNQIANYLSNLTILEEPAQFGSLITRCPSAACTALIDEYILGIGPNPSKVPLRGAPLANPSVFVNGSNLNLGRTDADGLDLRASYILPTDHVGTWHVGLTGSWLTKYNVQFAPGGATFDERNVIGFPPALRLRGNAGWTAGPWNAQVFVNFVNAYTNTETTPAKEVSAYTTIDLNLVYDFGVAFPGQWTRDLQFTFNVLNVANVDPPYVGIPISPNGGGGFDPNAANPIGRLISVQLQKRF